MKLYYKPNMLKIIETYSERVCADICIKYTHFSPFTTKTGIQISRRTEELLVNEKFRTAPYISIARLKKVILNAKLNFLKAFADKNAILLIIKHGDKNVGFKRMNLPQNSEVSFVSVNNMPFYTNKHEKVIDKKILNKIKIVAEAVSSFEGEILSGETPEEIRAAKLIVNTMHYTYLDSGHITKKDLEWLNEMYKKFKGRC